MSAAARFRTDPATGQLEVLIDGRFEPYRPFGRAKVAPPAPAPPPVAVRLPPLRRPELQVAASQARAALLAEVPQASRQDVVALVDVVPAVRRLLERLSPPVAAELVRQLAEEFPGRAR